MKINDIKTQELSRDRDEVEECHLARLAEREVDRQAQRERERMCLLFEDWSAAQQRDLGSGLIAS